MINIFQFDKTMQKIPNPNLLFYHEKMFNLEQSKTSELRIYNPVYSRETPL